MLAKVIELNLIGPEFMWRGNLTKIIILKVLSE